MKLALSEQIRRIDAAAIERYGIPGVALMESAGAGAAREILRMFPRSSGRGVAVLAGKGGNGGDGFVVARHLAGAGREVLVLLAGSRVADLSGDAKRMASAWVASGGAVLESADAAAVTRAASNAGVVVDALLGTGSEGAPRGAIAEAILALNAACATAASPRHGARGARGGNPAGEARARVVALDVPSGVDASTGEVPGAAVVAECTVTFGIAKLGLESHPGARHAGRVVVVRLGWPRVAVEAETFDAETLEARAMGSLLRPFDVEAHKGSRGRVLIVAGRDDRPGAAALAALAAFRAGAGTVTVATTERAARDVVAAVPEVMPEPFGADNGELAAREASRIAALAARADAVAIGPGFGTGPGPAAVLEAVLATATPAILDADALTVLGGRKRQGPRSAAQVLTPHPGEMARLMGVSTEEVQARRVHFAREAARLHGVVLLKGARTLVAEASGAIGVNLSGNPGLATAGAGDVLSGLIAALLARGLSARDAARAGAWAHGAAADLAAREIGAAGFVARDVADRLPRVMEAR